MDIIIGIIAFILVLGAIIIVHEGGHFLFARKANILTREFAFGMGPIIYKKKKGETLYTIRAFPIGGFCAIAGEEFEDDPLKGVEKIKVKLNNNVITKIYLDSDDDDLKDLPTLYLHDYDIFDKDQTGHLYINAIDEGNIVPYSVDSQAIIHFKKEEFQIAPYNRTLGAKTKRQRGLVMFGGAMMNFFLALLVFFIAALFSGFPDYNSSVLGKLEPDSTSAYAGLKENDKIIHLQSGSLEMEINKWSDISEFMKKYKESYPGTKINVTCEGCDELKVVQPTIIINSAGIMNNIESNKLEIGDVLGPAKEAGLEVGMTIIAIDGEPVGSWSDVYNRFEANTEGKPMKITTDKSDKEFTITPYSKYVLDNQRSIGGAVIPMVSVLLDIAPKNKFNLGMTLAYPFKQFGNAVMMVINTFKLLFTPNTGIGVDDLSGFVGIFSMTKTIANAGIIQLLLWTGILSVNIGFINLLPIPALDGGRLLFLGYEAVTGKKANQKVETALITATFFLLLGLIIFVTFNDIARLFS